MLHHASRRSEPAPFQDDPDALQAIMEQRMRVAEFARQTRMFSHTQFRNDFDRQTALRVVRQMKEDIESRFRSGGIVDHEMDAAWDALIAAAEERLGRKVDIYPLPEPREPIQPSTLKRKRKLTGGFTGRGRA